ncbi:MAG: hypothetical protein ABIQ95_08620 [Bdellovibrionia bacterium]
MTTKTKDSEIEIYLGKANKIYGPFSPIELDQMATDGKLATFVWIWDHSGEHWKPLETPPPAPIKTLKTPGKAPEWSTDSALCYDQFNTVSGTLDAITETGCVLMSNHSGAVPKFAIKSHIAINVLDSKRKNAKKSEARVISVVREQNQWAYRLRWLTSR